MSGQLHAPVGIPLQNSPQYPLKRRLGGYQNHFEYFGEEINVSVGNQIVTPRLCSL